MVIRRGNEVAENAKVQHKSSLDLIKTVYIDGEKVDLGTKTIDDLIPAENIEGIEVKKEAGGKGEIYITTKKTKAVEKTIAKGNMKVEGKVVDEQGEPGRREVFRRFQPGEGIPDGAAIDVEGCYWSAMFDGWRIARFSPHGEELESYPMPVRCPTMVCFGGADMKTLYITTTRENMEDDELAQYPLSGAIFTLPVAVAGMKKLPFREC